MQVKICGVRSREDAAACVRAGADFAGLNFVSGARRAIEPATATSLIAELRGVTPVGVFRDATHDEIRAIAEETGLAWVQLHGHETPDFCARLATTYKVIKALSGEESSNPDLLRAYAGVATTLLCDGRNPGSGQPWSWATIQEYGGVCGDAPIFLAGGLDPENVEEAIRVARPAGVDTASGVEVDGRMAADRVMAFCRAARRATGGGAR